MNDGMDFAQSGAALVSELALSLHRQRGVNLRIEVPAGAALISTELPEGCSLTEEAELRFASLEARNVVVASAALASLQSPSGIDADELFDRAYELWRDEIGRNDHASGRLLALASANTDIFAVGSQRIRNGSDVFNVLHLVESALPHLHRIEVGSIIDLFVAKHELTKDDMLGGVIHGALESWLETRADQALELHARVLENLSEATASLIGNTVVALAKSDYAAAVELARKDVRLKAPVQARVGVWTLGRLLLDERAPSTSIDVVIKTVIELIELEQGELRSQAIRAAAGAMHCMAAFDPILQRLAEVGDQDVLCAGVTALFLKEKELSGRGITPRWIELMALLKPEFKGAIRNLDHVMSRLLSDPANAPIVVSALGNWVEKHGHGGATDSETAKLFEQTMQQLAQLPSSLALLVTDWLLSDAQEHPAALAEFLTQLSHHSIIELSLDKERLDGLTPEDLLFLARRLLGYVHDRAQLTSLVLSMILSNDSESRIYPLLRTLLVDEIGYDYPGSTAIACRNAGETASQDIHKDFLGMLAETIEKVAEVHSSLPRLNELRPPTRLRRLFARARAKQMDESFEEASQDFIWRQIATQITIKAGQGTFSYRNANYGPSTKLASMSHSIELPRREAFDPIGNAIRHFGFRIAKRGKS